MKSRIFSLSVLALTLTAVSAEAQYSVRRQQPLRPALTRPGMAGRVSDAQLPLDPPYPRLAPGPVRKAPPSNGFNRAFPVKSNTAALLQKQSPVRAQQARGTCSIFSATALVEYLLADQAKVRPDTVDLAEEYMEYLAMRGKTSDGSNAFTNLQNTARYGITREETMPYVGVEWKDLNYPGAAERCGKVPANILKSCLLGHRDPRLLEASVGDLMTAGGPLYDPEFLKIREEAFDVRDKRGLRNLGVTIVHDETQIKKLLAAGVPLIFEADFFYGAWNHGKASELGIGRDMNLWAAGFVGYPEPGSVDYEQSMKNRAGHSVLAVGYDDNVEVTTQQRMKDGSVKTFKYKGVYYFKNSWGTSALGSAMQIDGIAAPGYGAITQKYAHEYGQFFQAVSRR